MNALIAFGIVAGCNSLAWLVFLVVRSVQRRRTAARIRQSCQCHSWPLNFSISPGETSFAEYRDHIDREIYKSMEMPSHIADANDNYDFRSYPKGL